MRRTCISRGKDEEMHAKRLVGKHEWMILLERLRVGARIILKWILNRVREDPPVLHEVS